MTSTKEKVQELAHERTETTFKGPLRETHGHLCPISDPAQQPWSKSPQLVSAQSEG